MWRELELFNFVKVIIVPAQCARAHYAHTMYKGGTEKIMTSSSCAIIIVVLILSLHEERLQGQEEVSSHRIEST